MYWWWWWWCDDGRRKPMCERAMMVRWCGTRRGGLEVCTLVHVRDWCAYAPPALLPVPASPCVPAAGCYFHFSTTKPSSHPTWTNPCADSITPCHTLRLTLISYYKVRHIVRDATSTTTTIPTTSQILVDSVQHRT